MSDEPTNGKPYEAMTPEERQRLMDFILNQQAQFFTGITGLLQVNAKHERRLERAENILRSGVVLGRRVRSRVGQAEKRVEAAETDLSMVKDLLMDAARVSGENSRDINAVNRDLAAVNQRLDRLTAATEANTQAIGALTEAVAKRNGNGGA